MANDKKSPVEILKDLRRQEEVSTPGAFSMTPKQSLLDASDAQAARPGKRIRWVNLRDPQKITSRKAEGYSIIPSEEGGRRLGDDLVLMEQNREIYDRKVAHIEGMNKQRLSQHKTEMERVVEGVARELRDRHGLDVNLNRLFVKEG